MNKRQWKKYCKKKRIEAIERLKKMSWDRLKRSLIRATNSLTELTVYTADATKAIQEFIENNKGVIYEKERFNQKNT